MAAASLEGKLCIVTGANTGIGKETARGLVRLGATVVVACRDVAKGEAAKADIDGSTGLRDRVHVMGLDLASFASIRRFAAEVGQRFGKLQLLVNNAGVWPSKRQTTQDGLELTFGTNHVGTFLLTRELLPLLQAGAPARIVNLSSSLHYRGKLDWEDLQFERRPFAATAAYNQSKLANVLFTNALARRLAGTGVTVNAVHPGVVATELARHYPRFLVAIAHLFMRTPEEGARTSLHVATSAETATVSGRYFESSREKIAAKAGLDEAAQERLWTLTEQLVAAPAVRAA